jgi:excisionase family DNA binding protein
MSGQHLVHLVRGARRGLHGRLHTVLREWGRLVLARAERLERMPLVLQRRQLPSVRARHGRALRPRGRRRRLRLCFGIVAPLQARAAGDFEAALRALIAEVVREELDRRDATRAQPEYLSPAAAGKIADVTAATIRRWIREGRLPAHHAGSRVRVLRSDLECMLRSGRSRSGHDSETPVQVAARLLRQVR